MPYVIFKDVKTGGWKIRKKSDGKVYQKIFLNRQAALNTSKNWLRYADRRTPKVKGNLIY